jgi:hypothetical protein
VDRTPRLMALAVLRKVSHSSWVQACRSINLYPRRNLIQKADSVTSQIYNHQEAGTSLMDKYCIIIREPRIMESTWFMGAVETTTPWWTRPVRWSVMEMV